MLSRLKTIVSKKKNKKKGKKKLIYSLTLSKFVLIIAAFSVALPMMGGEPGKSHQQVNILVGGGGRLHGGGGDGDDDLATDKRK